MKTLSQLCQKVKISSEYGAVEVPEGWTPGTHPYKVTLRYQGRQFTLPFFQGPALTEEPDAPSVISCLLLDSYADQVSFEEWAGEFGYDPDSRKAEATYNACRKNAKGLRQLLGDDYETFDSAENDV